MQTTISSIIRGRRTIHNFQQQPRPQREQIIAAIEHAVCAPNHYNTEPWGFYLLGEETVERICRLNAEQLRLERGDKAAEIKLLRWREIPGWMVMTCKRAEDPVQYMEDYAACCCAAQNFMLYLWHEGVGVKWSTGPVTRERQFYEILGIDPDLESLVGLFWYGYPQDVPQIEQKSHQQKLFELP